MFLIIVASLLAHLRALIKLHAEGAENKTFVFLSAWTIGLWTVFPIVFVLEKTHAMGVDAGAVVQTVLDILAKVSKR
jgi:bacteriorhodopsin